MIIKIFDQNYYLIIQYRNLIYVDILSEIQVIEAAYIVQSIIILLSIHA